MPRDPAQQAAIREVCDRLGHITDLALGGISTADEVVAIQVDCEAIDGQFEELNREVKFAREAGVAWDCLYRIRDAFLPEDLRIRFPAESK